MPPVDKEAVCRHWDQVAETYARRKDENRDYFDALKALFCAALPQAGSWRILEVGCGNGDVLGSLAPRFGLGVDLSEGMIAVARRRHAGCRNLQFQVGDAEDLSEADMYDAVILPDLLEHVPNWRRVLSQGAACLRPGGRLALSTPNPLWAPALYVLERTGLKMPEGPHRFVGLKAIVRHLSQLGLVNVRAANHLLIPKNVGAFTAPLNSAFQQVPLLKHLGVIQFAAASRPK